MIADHSAESMLLITCLLNQNARLRAIERLDINDFDYTPHQKLWKVMLDLEKEQVEPNIVTVRNRMIETGVFETAGGDEFLINMYHAYPVSYAIDNIIDILITMSKRRKLYYIGLEMVEKTKNQESINDLMLDYDSKIRQVFYDRYGETKTMSALLKEGVDSMVREDLYIKSPFPSFNFYTRGFRKGDYIILAARPGIGKTAIALNIARYVGQTYPVIFFSLEMPEYKMCNRIISSMAEVETWKLESGVYTDSERVRVSNAVEEAKKLHIEFVSNKRYIHEIISIARRRHQENNIGMIIVDYVQRVKMQNNRNMQRYQIIGEISGELQGLAIELNVPIIALAQLSRIADDREPSLVDLRESGDLEQDARLIAFIHVEKVNRNLGESSYPADLIIKKNDSGGLGRIELMYEGRYTRFYER